MGVYNKYPKEVHEFVKKWTSTMTDEELAEACNLALGTHFTENSMKSFRKNHNYYFGRKKWTGEEYWKHQKIYPQGMYEFIRDNSKGVPAWKMAEMVNEKFNTHYTESGIKQFRKKHGISSGLTGQFKKGCVSPTKGKKFEEIVKDPEKAARSIATRFKKGNSPANEKPVGTITKTTDGYLIRKKQMEGSLWDRWEFLHRAVWEEHNGPIPEGMLVAFKDKNKNNCDINNLMLITKGENSTLTQLGYRFEDPDLTEAGLNIIRLKKAMQEKRK